MSKNKISKGKNSTNTTRIHLINRGIIHMVHRDHSSFTLEIYPLPDLPKTISSSMLHSSKWEKGGKKIIMTNLLLHTSPKSCIYLHEIDLVFPSSDRFGFSKQ
ncbi:unnamed protein product [Ilex paraguariensis]|uniref:Uncharacterized protein n=1 Tax=Ilex paraguariensis TaxID=185542 RepID=A0ABC8TVV5_9AQUA